MEIPTGYAKLIGDTLVISNVKELNIPNGAKKWAIIKGLTTQIST